MKGKVLLRGGCVLTLDPRAGNFAQADVLVEDGRVAEIGEGLRARDAELVDATDTIVMPGFIDSHRHAWESLFRNLGGGTEASAPIYGPHYQPDDVYAATLIGLLGAIDSGITTIVDWNEIGSTPEHVESALAAHAESGIRSVFAYGAATWTEFDWAGGLRRLHSFWRKSGTENRAGFTPEGLAAGPLAHSDVDAIASDWELARELGLRIHAHAGPEMKGRVSDLAKRGLLGKDVTLVHCSGLNESDVEAIAQCGTSVSATPASEMAGGLGPPPIQKLMDRGIRPGLGVDNERVAPGDLFAQMRATISYQHANLFDLKLAGKAGVPRLLTTREVIRFATVDGARVAGLGGVVGTLQPGMLADLILLRTDRPNIFPINDPIGAVVWGMDTSNVDSVFVGGQRLKRDGVLEADFERARDLAVAAQQRVGSAAGLLVGMATTA